LELPGQVGLDPHHPVNRDGDGVVAVGAAGGVRRWEPRFARRAAGPAPRNTRPAGATAPQPTQTFSGSSGLSFAQAVRYSRRPPAPKSATTVPPSAEIATFWTLAPDSLTHPPDAAVHHWSPRAPKSATTTRPSAEAANRSALAPDSFTHPAAAVHRLSPPAP